MYYAGGKLDRTISSFGLKKSDAIAEASEKADLERDDGRLFEPPLRVDFRYGMFEGLSDVEDQIKGEAYFAPEEGYTGLYVYFGTEEEILANLADDTYVVGP